MFLEQDIPKEQLKELMAMDPNIKQAEERLEWLGQDEASLELYRAREYSLHERANMIYSAEARGREEGRIAEKEALAMNLLIMGMGIYVISQATGLPLEEIEKLKDQL